jgi:aldehyde:ferredoxin oxidoreductase
MGGYHGHYRRIDLSAGGGAAALGASAVASGASTVALPEAVLRQVLGGIGLGTWLLLQETRGDYDALAPEAPLVFAFAPLAGSALNTTAKAAVVSKSPLTRRLNDAMISSRFALVGKGAGADALVIVGACREWSTLFVEPEGHHLRPTPELLGLSAAEAEARIRERWGADWCVVTCGPAGEAGVPFATLSHDGRHASRGGTGAVLGSKRLKAIAVRGERMPAPAHPERVEALRTALKQASLGPGTEKYRSTGTLGNLLVFDRMGILPTRNFQQGSHPSAERLSVERLLAGGQVTRATCADCMIGCEKRVSLHGGKPARLEYENIFALGPLLDIWDMELVLRASSLCDEVGLDTITFGGTLAFAGECAEKGLLDSAELRRPAREIVLDAIALTARREGYGALLALGSRELARQVGGGSEGFAPHVKGLEIPGYHPAGMQTLGLGLAVGSRGADHNKSGAYDLDFSGTVDRFQLDPRRIEEMVEIEDQAAVMDSLILCKFVRRALRDLYTEGAEMLSAVTGAELDADDLRAAGRTIHHLKKLFNQRQGWNHAEDTLPARFLAAPGSVTEEMPPIDPEQFLAARSHYYRQRGWDAQGRLPPEGPFIRRLQLG